jgi:hypothetical protein
MFNPIRKIKSIISDYQYRKMQREFLQGLNKRLSASEANFIKDREKELEEWLLTERNDQSSKIHGIKDILAQQAQIQLNIEKQSLLNQQVEAKAQYYPPVPLIIPEFYNDLCSPQSKKTNILKLVKKEKNA